MRTLWFMPMTFLAGIHGFAYFVPYLAFIGVTAVLIGYSRKTRRILLPAPAFSPTSELEMAPA